MLQPEHSSKLRDPRVLWPPPTKRHKDSSKCCTHMGGATGIPLSWGCGGKGGLGLGL